MNSNNPPPDDSWESDAVWNLLDKAPPMEPRASFTDDLVRMVKLEPAPQPWWKRLLTPAPLGAIATAAAAVALGMMSLKNGGTSPDQGLTPVVVADVAPQADPYADLQDLAETEILIAAVDHLDDFSDQELGNLIGF